MNGVKNMEITRTQATETAYRTRYMSIEKQARAMYPVSPGTRVLTGYHKLIIVDYLCEKAKTIRPSTLRQYKAAIVYVWSQENPRDPSIERIKEIKCVAPELRKQLPHRTSSAKAKSFRDQDYKKIDCALEKAGMRKNSKYSLVTRLWLHAGILSGLRPCEWKNAVIVKDKSGRPFIRVQNAKHTNGRSHGKFRHIDISSLSQDEFECINAMVDLAHWAASQGKYKRVQEGCRHAFGKAARSALGPRKKYPTIYTCRHQFCANSKSAGLSRSATAALMGHATDQTATRHYGRKQAGRGKFRVKPVEAEVALVRKIARTREENILRIANKLKNKGRFKPGNN